jgi:hypothetical protein
VLFLPGAIPEIFLIILLVENVTNSSMNSGIYLEKRAEGRSNRVQNLLGKMFRVLNISHSTKDFSLRVERTLYRLPNLLFEE